VKYATLKSGEFRGDMHLVWKGPDTFEFIPNPSDPFCFVRHDQTVIVPGRMVTTGGSIPRALWFNRFYSPWGYAPAFIIHDWLFDAHKCGYPGYDKLTVDDAADMMSEGVKTLMEKDPARRRKFVLASMDTAVRSSIARRLWEAMPDDDCLADRGLESATPTIALRGAKALIGHRAPALVPLSQAPAVVQQATRW
jgi:hypothetical protein